MSIPTPPHEAGPFTLKALGAEFIHTTAKGWRLVKTLKAANGVQFKCPKCYAKNKGPIGTHMVICWFTGVPQTVSPMPGRWNPEGTSLADLSFIPPGAVSVLLMGGCNWHGYVANGKAG